ncbi:MAG: SpoIIE family protein phosphatase [Candidatus Promineifilaceae bacterium]
MIAQLYANASTKFDTLAASWLDLGAASFSISEYGKEIQRWPHKNSCQTMPLSAPIQCMGLTLGNLHVQGLAGPIFQHKLEADAALLANIIQLEGEMEAITSELVDAQDHLLAFYDIGRSTRNLLNLDQIIRAVTEAVHQMSQVECSFTILKLPDRDYFFAQIPSKYINQETISWSYEQLLREQNTLINNNNDSAAPLPSMISNLLISPLRYHGEIIGGIGLVNHLTQKFSTPDVKLIEAICQQAEVKIENAIFYEKTLQQTRMETEMALAQKVQLQLLPQKPPSLPSLDIAASSLPALQVGGDFFDFIQVPGGPLIFTVGDVAGKGMSSALLMAMSRTAIRGAVKMLQTPLPELVLDRANEDLYDDFTEVGMFATMFVGHVLPGTGALIYANAGHSPVVYCPQDAPPILLEADGTAVGVLPINLAKNQTIRFRSGDILVVATDGFSEASNPQGELFGYDRLLELIGQNRQLSARALFQLLHDAINEFSQSKEQDDDQTIIILKAN